MSRRVVLGVEGAELDRGGSFSDVSRGLTDAKSVLDGDGTLLRDGAAFHERREIKFEPDGLSVEFSHAVCGRNYLITVSWTECLALASGERPRTLYAAKLYPGGMSFVEQFPSAIADLSDWEPDTRLHSWSLRGMRCNCSASSCQREDMRVLIPVEESVEAVEWAKRRHWVPQAAIDWCEAALKILSKIQFVEVDESHWEDTSK